MNLFKLIHLIRICVLKVWEKFVAIPYRRGLLGKCGKNVRIGRRTRASGWKNIYAGNNVHIGVDSVFLTTRAKIIIGDHVVFGPRVTCISGDHRTDIIGRYIDTVTDKEKLPENDADIVFEGDNWIGANLTILKGVTIGEGSVVAACSLVVKDVAPYTIVGGVPAKKIKDRFSPEELKQHKCMVNLKND